MSAEPTLQPIDYEPALNAEGNSYVDKVPPTNLLSRGIKCNCSGRTTFTSRSSLLAHFKSITHQRRQSFRTGSQLYISLAYLKSGRITSLTRMMITAIRNMISDILFMPCIYFIHWVLGSFGSRFLM